MTECNPILVVEDDDDVREVLSEFLEHRGYDVLTAINGQEALELLEDQGIACLILLDLMMPVMDGYEFRSAQKQRASIAGIPVVVITADGSVQRDRVEAAAIFRKPLDLNRLVSTIEKYC